MSPIIVLLMLFGNMLPVMLIFMHIRLVFHRKLGRTVAASGWAWGDAALAQLSIWVSINLGIGVLMLLVTLMPWIR